MSIRFAFAGFRHGHINDLYRLAGERDDTEVVAACEEHEPTRTKLSDGKVAFTHTNIDKMLDEVDCDVVAIGDYYARRGSIAIQALKMGKHVIADKPLCTSLDELDEIERISGEKGLSVGTMLTMRDHGQTIGVKQMIEEGVIGEVHAMSFGGQHPLMLGSRPEWYFEKGKHGGTINDIAIHAIDVVPWMTGLEFDTVKSARCWNAFATDFPHFKDGAQMMLTMNNGCGLLGDVSYFMPDKAGYSLPFYWRYTFWGREGVIETSTTTKEIIVARHNSEKVESRPLPADTSGGYLEAFLKDMRGEATPLERGTVAVIKAARTALKIQQAGDENLFDVKL
jgi:predicted dehydrogenase